MTHQIGQVAAEEGTSLLPGTGRVPRGIADGTSPKAAYPLPVPPGAVPLVSKVRTSCWFSAQEPGVRENTELTVLDRLLAPRCGQWTCCGKHVSAPLAPEKTCPSAKGRRWKNALALPSYVQAVSPNATGLRLPSTWSMHVFPALRSLGPLASGLCFHKHQVSRPAETRDPDGNRDNSARMFRVTEGENASRLSF